MSPVELPPVDPSKKSSIALFPWLFAEPTAWAVVGLIAIGVWFLIVIATNIVI